MHSSDPRHLVRGLVAVGALLLAVAQLSTLRPAEPRRLEQLPIPLLLAAR